MKVPHVLPAVLRAAAAVLVPLLAAAAPAAAQQVQKLAYVDSDSIIKATPGVTEARSSYEKTAEEWKAALETKRRELSGLYDEYQKQSAILSPETRTEKQQGILQKEREMQEYFQQKFGPQGEAGVRERELLEPIYERINKAIEEVRAAEGYALIFDIQAGALAAGDPTLNVTDKVIARLQQTQATASSAPAPAAAPAQAQ